MSKTRASRTRRGTAQKGDALARLVLSQTHSIYYLHKTAPSPSVTAVAMASMASTIGNPSMSINASMAHEVLQMLDDEGFTVPSNCSAIYNGTLSRSYDTLDQKLPKIECSDTLTGSNPANFSAAELGKLLYACNKQFYFGSSGPHKDTYGIPLLNEPPGPYADRFWSETKFYNATTPWSVKSRIFLGFRFGWSLWAYTPSVLALGFLTMDAAVVLLAEVTIQKRLTSAVDHAVSIHVAFRQVEDRLIQYVVQRKKRMSLAVHWSSIPSYDDRGRGRLGYVAP